MILTLVVLYLAIVFHQSVKSCAPIFVDEDKDDVIATTQPQTPGPPGRWTTITDETCLKFFVLGDFGGSNEPPFITDDQLHTADAMTRVANTFQPQFLITLGDNFYNEGVRSINDPRFQVTFENVYDATSLQVPWYISAGNHDWEGNITAQIRYSTISKRWKFPGNYYTQKFEINPNSTMLLVIIDTVVLCGNVHHDLPGSPPIGPADHSKAEQHWNWIEEQLQASNDSYVLVGGHYPVWSIGSHGPTDCLVSRLRPLLEKYRVTAYFGGHDHNLQHIRDSNCTLDYFVSGAAHNIDPSTNFKDSFPNDWSLFHFRNSAKRGGFAYVTAAESEMTLTFVDSTDTKDLYEVVMKPRHFN